MNLHSHPESTRRLPKIASSTSMSELLLVVFYVLTAVVLLTATDDSQIASIEEPEFAYLELHLVKVKFKCLNNTNTAGEGRNLFVCWDCNVTGNLQPSTFTNAKCRNQPRCPNYKEVEDCLSHGNYKLCQIKFVTDDIILQGYVSQRDSKNITLRSKVATYITNDSTKAPRPVTNLNIKQKNGDLILNWTPSEVFYIETKYSQWVSCKPVEDKNAKAFRTMLEFQQPSLVIQSFNISAVTKYRCCIQVENVVNSIMSERTCQNVVSLEQVPSGAPVILCGNNTQCPSKVQGMQRNVTILFKLPKVNERNGKITHHVLMYRNITASNFTIVKLTNGSATWARLIGLKSQTSYVVWMKSCNDAGCSPPSNTVEIPAIKHNASDNGHMTKIIVIVATTIGAVMLIMIGFLFLFREKPILPDLRMEVPAEYDYPAPRGEIPIYNILYKDNKDPDKIKVEFQVNLGITGDNEI